MKTEELFRTGSVWKAITKTALPAMFSILLMILYNLADMFFVAQTGDIAQVAAVSVVGPMFSILMAVGSMIGGGGCAMIAKTLGKGDMEMARTYSSLCCWGALGFGVLFAAIVLPAMDPILRFLGADATMWDHAQAYLGILALGAPFILFSNAMGNVVRAEGAVKAGLIGGLLGTAINVVLDPIFINVLKMGVGGAALATVLANVVSCVYYFCYLRGKDTAMSMKFSDTRRKPLALFSILALGLPNAFSSFLAGFAGTFSNQILVGYGTVAVAAMAAAGKATMVISMVQMGICMGVQPLMAFSYGARDIPRLGEIIKKITLLTLACGVGLTALCFAGREMLVSLFIKQAEAASLGQRMMTLMMVSGPFLGFYYISSNFLQASGNAPVATVISVLRQGIILIPMLYLMNRMFQIEGIAYAHIVADIGATLVAIAALFIQYSKLKKSSVKLTA